MTVFTARKLSCGKWMIIMTCWRELEGVGWHRSLRYVPMRFATKKEVEKLERHFTHGSGFCWDELRSRAIKGLGTVR